MITIPDHFSVILWLSCNHLSLVNLPSHRVPVSAGNSTYHLLSTYHHTEYQYQLETVHTISCLPTISQSSAISWKQYTPSLVYLPSHRVALSAGNSTHHLLSTYHHTEYQYQLETIHTISCLPTITQSTSISWKQYTPSLVYLPSHRVPVSAGNSTYHLLSTYHHTEYR